MRASYIEFRVYFTGAVEPARSTAEAPRCWLSPAAPAPPAHCSLARRPRPDSLLFRPPQEPRTSPSLPASPAVATGGGTGEDPAAEQASLADGRPPVPSSAWRMPSAALRNMRPGERFFFFLTSWSCVVNGQVGGEGAGVAGSAGAGSGLRAQERAAGRERPHQVSEPEKRLQAVLNTQPQPPSRACAAPQASCPPSTHLQAGNLAQQLVLPDVLLALQRSQLQLQAGHLRQRAVRTWRCGCRQARPQASNYHPQIKLFFKLFASPTTQRHA